MTGRSPLFSSTVLILCAGLAFGLPMVSAQSTGTFQGRVMDPNGAALVGVPVTSQDQATHAQRSTTTQPDGLYQIDNLLPGVFAVTNNHPIFSKLDGIFANPFNSDLLNLRFDLQATDRSKCFSASALTNETVASAVAVSYSRARTRSK